MEVIGAVASIIAIGHALNSMPRVVNTLKLLPAGKSQVISLVNELETLRATHAEILGLVETFGALDKTSENPCADLIAAPGATLLHLSAAELDALVSDLQELCRDLQAGPNKASKLRRWRLIWSKDKVSGVYDRVRAVRLNLQVAMTALSLRCHQSQTKLLLEIRDISCSSVNPTDTAASGPEDLSQVVISSGSNPHHQEEVNNEIFSVEAYLPGRCSRGCNCQCHFTEASTRSSPWLAPFLGSLFLNYNSVPLIRPIRCNHAGCRHMKSSLSFRYYFPYWLWARYISFNASIRSMADLGASINMSIPRVIPFSERLWYYPWSGDVHGFQQFVRGTVILPTDHTETGISILTQTLNHRHLAMVDFLTSLWAPLLRSHGVARDSLAVARTWLWEVEREKSLHSSEHEQTVLRKLIAYDREPDEYVRTKVHLAVLDDHDNNGDAVSQALRDEPSALNRLDQYGFAPVHLAAEHGRAGAMRALIAAGADVDVCNALRNTALHYAAIGGHADCVRLLVGPGAAALDPVSASSWQPIHCAAGVDSPGRADVLRILLLRRPSLVHAREIVGRTPLMTLAEASSSPFASLLSDDIASFTEALNLLLDAGADLEARNRNGLTVLLEVAMRSDVAKLALLLSAGARIDAASDVGSGNVLHLAAAFGSARLLAYLLSGNLGPDAERQLDENIDPDLLSKKFGGTPWDALRFVMSCDAAQLTNRRRPTANEARLFARLFRRVRDRQLQRDVDVLTAALHSLWRGEGGAAVRCLASLIQRYEARNRHKEAEILRGVGVKAQKGMWDAAGDLVESCIEACRDEMKSSPWARKSCWGGPDAVDYSAVYGEEEQSAMPPAVSPVCSDKGAKSSGAETAGGSVRRRK